MRTRRMFIGSLAVAVLVPLAPVGGVAANATSHEPACLGSTKSSDFLGRNVIVGTNKADKINGTAGADVIIGRGGKDTINGRGGDDLICGSEDAPNAPDGRDVIRGGPGFDMIVGGAGNDRLFGNGERDNLFGGIGDDYMNGGGNDPGVGDEANFWFATGPVKASLVTGVATGEGRDTLAGIEGFAGSSFADVLTGDNGDNALDGGGGNDTLTGLGGTDTLTLTFASGNSWVNLEGGTSVAIGQGSDTISGFENVLGGDHDDYVTGTRGQNVLLGSGGHDKLYGRGGDDILLGLQGNDKMYGGAGGFDFTSYSDRPDLAVNIDLLNSNATRSDGTDTLEGIEMVEGSNQADTIRGDHGVNYFYADEGDDTVNGEGGSDMIFFLGAGPGGVNVDLGMGRASGMADTNDALSNIEHVVGSNYKDVLVGDGNRNFLNGVDGVDKVVGAGENDYIAGGAGNDHLEGGPGAFDMVDFFQSSKGVTLDLAKGEAFGEGAKDVLFDIESASGSAKGDVLRGNAKANALYGQNGIDELLGLGGDDHLDGGKATDTLNGGPADDECFTKAESTGCEDFSKPDEHPLSTVSRRYKKAIAAARRYKRRYK